MARRAGRERGDRKLKTSELIAEVEKMGYHCGDYRTGERNLFIRNSNGDALVYMDTEKMYVMSTDFYNLSYISDESKEALLNLTVEYIKTPVSERNVDRRRENG